MSQLHRQAVVGRAYADGAFRQAIAGGSPEWRAGYDLTDEEAEKVRDLFAAKNRGLRLFLDMLASKQFERFSSLLKPSVQAFGEESLEKAWNAYYVEHRSGLMGQPFDEALRYLAWLREANELPNQEPRRLADVTRVNESWVRLIQVLRNQRREAGEPVFQRRAAEAPPATATPAEVAAAWLTATPHEVITVHTAPSSWVLAPAVPPAGSPGAAGTAAAATPPAPVEEPRERLLVVYLSRTGEVRNSAINAATRRLLGWCDGSRTGTQVAQRLLDELRAAGAQLSRALAVICRLVNQDIIRLREAGPRPGAITS